MIDKLLAEKWRGATKRGEGMKSLVTDIRLQFNKSHQPGLVLVLSLSPQQALEGVQELKEVLSKGKYLQAEIKQHRKRRSLVQIPTVGFCARR